MLYSPETLFSYAALLSTKCSNYLPAQNLFSIRKGSEKHNNSRGSLSLSLSLWSPLSRSLTRNTKNVMRRTHPDVPGNRARTDDDGIGEDDGLTRKLSVSTEASDPPDLAALLPSTPFTFPDRRWKITKDDGGRFCACAAPPSFPDLLRGEGVFHCCVYNQSEVDGNLMFRK